MNVALSFEVLGEVVVRGAKVNAVVHLRSLQRATPLPRRLVERVKQVVAFAVLKKSFCVLLQPET